MALDHVGLNVSDLAASTAFYAAALEPLGYELGVEHGEHAGFRSPERRYDFWLARRDPVTPSAHVCFASSDRATVDAFHGAALAGGGRDNGPPGLRPEYHESYYGAYVLDLDGNNVEAACHEGSS